MAKSPYRTIRNIPRAGVVRSWWQNLLPRQQKFFLGYGAIISIVLLLAGTAWLAPTVKRVVDGWSSQTETKVEPSLAAGESMLIQRRISIGGKDSRTEKPTEEPQTPETKILAAAKRWGIQNGYIFSKRLASPVFRWWESGGCSYGLGGERIDIQFLRNGGDVVRGYFCIKKIQLDYFVNGGLRGSQE
ncbi:hypothetical protein A3D62_01140 [Candidatus Kaiserbacteria bacterium RIFCSPHIGHO2_02_FULL_49_11]|uniref:Uncharacterized protein n=1 Tax=Candidatus Kaiserbacteria bacterium RIFCSPHIGHO2_02_FULL_49_11 TaxID=1798489 RepID=A0A1F6D0Y9_9BACT|nr:MAG: hypothetical protein A3D62_01140 [Candidatus Kaiserbacteria bacterium RIFCSPHIGHO2_02_FULL_49_11]